MGNRKGSTKRKNNLIFSIQTEKEHEMVLQIKQLEDRNVANPTEVTQKTELRKNKLQLNKLLLRALNYYSAGKPTHSPKEINQVFYNFYSKL